MKNKESVDFLPEDLLIDLDELFFKLEEMNASIESALKFRSNSYFASIDVDELAEPLTDCRERLQAWIQENMGNPDYLPKKRSFFRIQW